MSPRGEKRLQDPISWWLHESLNDIESESYRRARMVLSASGLLAAIGVFSFVLQLSRGSNAAALIGVLVFLIIPVTPLILRYSGSIALAANSLTGGLFLGLTVVNVASAGHAPGAELALVLVALLGFLSSGQIWPSLWGILTLIELLLIPNLEALGFPLLIVTDPATAAQAIHRVPVILVAVTLVGGLISNRITVDSRRKKLEAQSELVELNVEKERLEQAMLERQKNLAAVGTLAASVAHQINNPIGAILAAAQFGQITRDDIGQENIANEAFELIEREARRCGQIVHSLLRISSGERAQKWVGDVHAVVNGAFNSVLPYAREKGATIRLNIGEAEACALISPIELEQAVVNLIRNGIESRDRGAIVVVRTIAEADRVRVEVRDNGRGLPEADCESVFEPFYTTRRQHGGSGLGLSVVRGIVEDHRGTIRAYSAPNDEGTVFEIELSTALDPLE